MRNQNSFCSTGIKSKKLLEFLIPTFKRPIGARRAARSIIDQATAHDCGSKVKISIVDDCSPEVSLNDIAVPLDGIDISVQRNEVNKGMSRNIFDMVDAADATFCTVLTDDDWLQPGALKEIIEVLERFDRQPEEKKIGGIFVPRYSYLETGELHCVVCQLFEKDVIIDTSPLNSLKYAHNGFILTGFFFRPELVDMTLWLTHIENGYFPVLNFGSILALHPIAFVNRNWFVHTVLNHCHWEAWGKTQKEQHIRLERDYINVIATLATAAVADESGFRKKFSIRLMELAIYRQRLLHHRNTGIRGHTYTPFPLRSKYWYRVAKMVELSRSLY